MDVSDVATIDVNLPTIIFLPGTLCDQRLWQAQMDALSANYTLVCASYPFATSIREMADLALSIVDPDQPVIPIGISMGAMVAAEIVRCARSRVVGLSIWDTDLGGDTAERRQSREKLLASAQTGSPFKQIVEEALLPRYLSPEESTGRSPTYAQARETILGMADALGLKCFSAQSTALAERRPMWDLLMAFDGPLLVGFGEHDGVCPAATHRMLCEARAGKHRALTSCIEIPTAGHLPTLTSPDAVTGALSAWLTQICGTAAKGVHENRCNSATNVATI